MSPLKGASKGQGTILHNKYRSKLSTGLKKKMKIVREKTNEEKRLFRIETFQKDHILGTAS